MNKISSEYYDKAFGFTLGVTQVICILFLIFFIISIVFNFFDYSIDDTDYSGFSRSGMSLHTDAKTGLQYLSKNGALIPRLNKDGHHIYIRTSN